LLRRLDMEIVRQMVISDSTQIVLNVGYVVALILFVWKVATDQSRMKNNIRENKRENKDLKDKLESLSSRVDSVESDHVEVKINMAKIDAKLEGIEQGILELKGMFKNSNTGG
jgi:peptidoglycan hydrolase CwlO-like protein